MTTSPLPLAQLAKGELEWLRKAIARRQLPTPLTPASLQASGKGALFARLGPLAGAGEEAALAMLDLALAVAELGGTPVGGRAGGVAELAWTVPDVTLLQVGMRATTPVVLELLGGAQTSVVIAGYEFDHGAVIFQPLHAAMRDRGVKAVIYLDVPPLPGTKVRLEAHLAGQVHRFVQRNWPFGPPVPDLYYWTTGSKYRSGASLHAKCIVVDGRRALIGSANFTGRGYKRNLEIGVRLDDAGVAAALVQQLGYLVQQGELVKLPPVTGRAAPPAAAEDDSGGAEGTVEVGAGPRDELVSEAARPLLRRLMSAGVVAPDVGDDVEGDRGEVIGSPELSWGAPKVAVLLPEQEGSREKLEAAGWTCFASVMDEDTFEALVERVRRGG